VGPKDACMLMQAGDVGREGSWVAGNFGWLVGWLAEALAGLAGPFENCCWVQCSKGPSSTSAWFGLQRESLS
jgi:hypothetical protein